MNAESSTKLMTAVVVGAGNRSLVYASYASKHPEELRIVGVVEPDVSRRRLAAERFGLPPEACFSTVEELTAGGTRLADAAINGTMDELHVETTVPLLRAGYHVLLEKPIGITEEEVETIRQEARRNDRIVMVCHVLRYAPFYRAIKERLVEGEIGEIVNIQTAEHVSYHHMAVSFVRGKWNSKEKCGSSMIMAKCCHDTDLLSWLAGDAKPVKVSSFGSLMQFRPDKAPEGSGTRCLVDCRIEDSCPYSARKNYIEQGLWKSYVWPNWHLGSRPTEEQLAESLRTDNPYGRCVWRCDNDVVDHQSVIVEFDSGATASHNMIGATSRPCRIIHIVGTKGEMLGVMEDGEFVVRTHDARKGREYAEEKVKIDVAGDNHGGGDLRLVHDFVRVLRGEQPSISTTSLDQSIDGHRIGFAAERARVSGCIVHL